MAENSLKRARGTVMIIVTLLCITLIAFVYAFVQQAEAKRQASLAIECERKSIEMAQQIEVVNRQAQLEFDRAEAVSRYAEELREKVESESIKK
jgi:uncharacterized ion transporter superfamily protein YfcC